jgi:hypothetical protein
LTLNLTKMALTQEVYSFRDQARFARSRRPAHDKRPRRSVLTLFISSLNYLKSMLRQPPCSHNRELSGSILRSTWSHRLSKNHVASRRGTTFRSSFRTADLSHHFPRQDPSVGGAGAGITGLRNKRSAGLGGFVAFMKREDAERAISEMDGFDWGGCVLRCGWGKSVPLPGRAVYGRLSVGNLISLKVDEWFCDQRIRIS